MSVKRIIPCLDLKDGRVVKGTKFVDIRDVRDPVEAAIEYAKQGADEIVLLDITSSAEARKTILKILDKVKQSVSIPVAVGGGIKSPADFEEIFAAGADKVSVNSAAVLNPQLIKEASDKFGSNRIVSAIDAAKATNGSWNVYINGGQTDTGKDVVEWAKEVEALGAGEILLTSIDEDGEKNGYDLPLTKAVAEAVSIPVTASGGAGKMEDFLSAFTEGKASAALAASLFHFGEIEIPKLKAYLRENGVCVSK